MLLNRKGTTAQLQVRSQLDDPALNILRMPSDFFQVFFLSKNCRRLWVPLPTHAGNPGAAAPGWGALLTGLSQDLVEKSGASWAWQRGTERQVSSWGRRLARSLSRGGWPRLLPR